MKCLNCNASVTEETSYKINLGLTSLMLEDLTPPLKDTMYYLCKGCYTTFNKISDKIRFFKDEGE